MSDSEILLKYFPEINSATIDRFSQLSELYRSWNEKINLISRKDMDHLFTHHILHSCSIAKVITFIPETKVIDVGTGGGFPGIPLAVLFPDVEFLLVDSIGKKIHVVNEIASALELKNVKGLKARVEEVDVRCDFVVSRAVASISQIYSWTRHLVDPGGKNVLKNGWLLLKGGDLKDEIKESGKRVKPFDISSFFSEDYFLSKQVIYFH